MLESMIKSPVPTRAEVSDIANAILDGTDAIMLSEESTLGDYPIAAVEMMSSIALKVENSEHHAEMLWGMHAHHIGVGHSTTLAVMEAAEKVDARYIVALSEYGYAARMVSRNRGHQPILVVTPNPVLFNQSCLMYGCYPVMDEKYKSFDEALTKVRPMLVKEKLVKKGDKVVIVSGAPFGKTEESNVMLIETI
jgi:pyruvate kinase